MNVNGNGKKALPTVKADPVEGLAGSMAPSRL